MEHLHKRRPTQFPEHDAVLCRIRLDAHGVAREWVRLGHVACPGAKRSTDGCCGWHIEDVIWVVRVDTQQNYWFARQAETVEEC